MEIYHLCQIGQFHTNHNEDAFIIEEIGTDKMLLAIMDGCSSGTDSHFASNLIGKILRKTAKNLYYQEFLSKEIKSNQELLKDCFKELFEDLKMWNSKLDLRYDELLSTVLVAIVDIKEKLVEILAIGDGVVCIDGKIIEYEQDNKPDYIGYHLNSDFEAWYKKQDQKLSITTFNDLSIASDGIWTFRGFDSVEYTVKEDSEICDLFFCNQEDMENEKMLFKKLIKMEKEHGLKPTDDLSIIRVIV